MSKPIDLLDIRILPCSFIKDALVRSWRVLAEGAEKKEGKILLVFKVVGESRLVAVLEGGTDSAVKFLNESYGNQITTECTPLRRYEIFAQHVLQSEETNFDHKGLQGSSGELFWLKFTYDYEGLSISQFLNAWKEECNFWMRLRLKNHIQFELFKVVGQKEVHMFMRVQSGDLLDDVLFTSPIIKILGNQFKVEVKSIIFINEHYVKM